MLICIKFPRSTLALFFARDGRAAMSHVVQMFATLLTSLLHVVREHGAVIWGTMLHFEQGPQ